MGNEREQPDGNCYEGDGCPKEKAVLARQWREYRRALENIRAGMVDAPNQNIVDYIDAVLTPNVEVTGLPQPADGSDTSAARCGRSG
jgi:hypothetical protein